MNPVKHTDFNVDSKLTELRNCIIERTELSDHLSVVVCAQIMVELERAIMDPTKDPRPKVTEVIDQAVSTLSSYKCLEPELVALRHDQTIPLGTGHTVDLFEQAWTTYSADTYEHSVGLVRDRLTVNGFDETFFRGKRCWDGGCGTGRLALVMAEFGADKVVAADLGGESLEFFKRICEERGLTNIEFLEQDVTDLSNIEQGQFDFVASNGVLHHTNNCEKGLLEHFRITKTGGVFWVYLYGKGGFYWHIYDQIREMMTRIPSKKIRAILSSIGLREGLIYTFLDNCLAPRVYYSRKQFLNLFPAAEVRENRIARGITAIDDTEILLSSDYGKLLLGPDGEIRHILIKG